MCVCVCARACVCAACGLYVVLGYNVMHVFGVQGFAVDNMILLCTLSSICGHKLPLVQDVGVGGGGGCGGVGGVCGGSFLVLGHFHLAGLLDHQSSITEEGGG